MRAQNPIAVLYPRYEHFAIEESYASWQTQMLLRRGEGHTSLHIYDPNEKACDAINEVQTEHVLIVTDPLVLPASRIGVRLREALSSSHAQAIVPVSNTVEHPKQFHDAPVPYLTLRELEEAVESLARQPQIIERVTWDESNAAIFLCRTDLLRSMQAPLRTSLAGIDVGILTNEYVHRWSSLRGQIRHDLIDRIRTDAKSILEIGCGEAALGEALKKRQKCRVVGIELDPTAAVIARDRIDEVHRGDVREIITLLYEKFDCIVGGDVIEHLDKPWSLLADLRRLSAPGGRLLLSIPNVAHASIISDLLQGRFDYVYMGITCVGHLRFFTRQSITDMLSIAGWSIEAIEPQMLLSTPAQNILTRALDRAGYKYSNQDITPTGYLVIARNV